MLKIKHKQFNLYLGKYKKIKRGKLVPLGNEFITDSLEEITRFYHDSNKGSLKGKLIIEINQSNNQ